jgi:hypothetical protein
LRILDKKGLQKEIKGVLEETDNPDGLEYQVSRNLEEAKRKEFRSRQRVKYIKGSKAVFFGGTHKKWAYLTELQKWEENLNRVINYRKFLGIVRSHNVKKQKTDSFDVNWIPLVYELGCNGE